MCFFFFGAGHKSRTWGGFASASPFVVLGSAAGMPGHGLSALGEWCFYLKAHCEALDVFPIGLFLFTVIII